MYVVFANLDAHFIFISLLKMNLARMAQFKIMLKRWTVYSESRISRLS